MEIIRHIQHSDSDYIRFDIKGGDSNWCIGDQVWFDRDGTKMEVEVLALEDPEVREELVDYIGDDLVDEIEEILYECGRQRY